jgi:hypothetical protein
MWLSAQLAAATELALITNSRPKTARYGPPMRATTASDVIGLSACTRLPSIASDIMQPGCRKISAIATSNPTTGPPSQNASIVTPKCTISTPIIDHTMSSETVTAFSGGSFSPSALERRISKANL